MDKQNSLENLHALQAIERGERADQDTLLRLHEAGWINTTSVTHMQSPGPESMFVGFTSEGFRLLKQTKALLISDLERQIVNAIVRGFLDRHEATSTRALLKQFKSPIATALHRLGDRAVLQVLNNTYLSETYLPKAIAFYHCGDSAALAFARKSTEIVFRVLPILFDRELEGEGNDQRQFTAEEVEKEARAIESSVEPNMIFTGLYLAQEFSVFTSIRRDDQQVGIVSFSLNERVYDKANIDWDKHIQQSNVSLFLDWQHANSEILPNSTDGNSLQIPAVEWEEPLPLVVEDAPVKKSQKVFLVHGHAEKSKQAVAAFLRLGRLEPIILHEQPNEGKTIIEKFEKHSNVVAFAVVLLTPDDFGGPAGHPENTSRRARQNVILELGYFMGKLGRGRVCCLYVDGVELPSDYQGVLWLRYDDSGAWRDQLAKELTAAGIQVDSQKSAGVPTEINGLHKGESLRPKVSDPTAERRWQRIRDEISRLPEYNREALRLLLEYPSLTDYTALQKLGQLARQNSLASVLPGLQNQTGIIRAVPGQPPTRQPGYDLHYEITPELRPSVERYFNEMA